MSTITKFKIMIEHKLVEEISPTRVSKVSDTLRRIDILSFDLEVMSTILVDKISGKYSLTNFRGNRWEGIIFPPINKTPQESVIYVIEQVLFDTTQRPLK